MSDPAVEAAMRAMGARADNRIAQGAAAAREALAPIRELHRPSRLHEPLFFTHRCAGCSDSASDVRWPCSTALFCYTTDEIEEMTK